MKKAIIGAFFSVVFTITLQPTAEWVINAFEGDPKPRSLYNGVTSSSSVLDRLKGLVWGSEGWWDDSYSNDVWIQDTDGFIFSVNSLADAIYLAEGAENARKPFGILSVPCHGYGECRQICINTIRNNIRRYADYGYADYPTYLDFLANRYAPIGAGNDPTNLNINWLKNVRSLVKL